MADAQRAAVYRWEWGWKDWRRANITQRQARQVMRTAERLYRLKPTTIQFRTSNKSRGKLMPSTYWEHGVVAFRPAHVNIATVLHETAHAVEHQLFGWDAPGYEDHGPRWLGIYLWLLWKFQVAPWEALTASARAAGLEWRHPSWVAPHVIRKRYRRAIRRAKKPWWA